VVMFGGVSLAIYMNGIAQELLKAVRATAPSEDSERFAQPDSQLMSTEKVYRKIAKILYHGRKAGEPVDPKKPATEPIRTRILIDILSGTSAGGINAVFLAKALANDQNLDEIHRIWLDEGDIDTLLNDEGSQPGTYRPDTPKTSLLNSQRMYGKLLEAFQGMDDQAARPAGYVSRLAKEIDLFVTTTDLNGVSLPIQLANSVVEERMHKAHFRFVYGPQRLGAPNDFLADYNPMLAFVSRCTSSFPGAFEPMKFSDVDFFLPGLSLDVQNNDGHPFHKFFAGFAKFGTPPVERPLGARRLAFTHRPLADGGYLNNKPFSFAIDTIRFRTSDLPIRRKLFFLDPFPELKSDLEQQVGDFNFVQNSLLAASTLPRYQTVREDIERLNNYNRHIRKACMLQAEVEKDLPKLLEQCLEKRIPEAGRKYEALDLDGMIRQYGQCYITYHRLCVSAATDELALLFTRLFGFNDESDALYAVRMLVHAWREDNYAPRKAESKQTENEFLWAFDLGYRMRRLEYVRGEIDVLLRVLANPNEADRRKELESILKSVLKTIDMTTVDLDKMRKDLMIFRKAAVDGSRNFAKRREQLWLLFEGQAVDKEADDLRANLRTLLRPADLTYDDLLWILSPVTDAESQDRATMLYRTGSTTRDFSKARPVKESFAKAAGFLATTLSEVLQRTSQEFLNVVNPEGKDSNNKVARMSGPPQTELAAHYLWIRYQYFECRDVIVYSLLPDALIGEGTWTEVYRISPIDAVGVFAANDERQHNKLAGTALMAFGAFLDREWRKNDILWGRLDGTERLITSLLPDDDDKNLCGTLVQEAAEIILAEDFSPHRCANMLQPLITYIAAQVEAKAKGKLARMTAEEFLEFAKDEMSADCPAVVRALIAAIQGNPDRLAVFRQYYMRPSSPPLELSLQRVRRAARIFGEMLRGLDGGQGIPTKLGGWVARAGTAATRFVEFSLPGTLLHVLRRHWLQLIYLAEFLLIGIGAVVYREAETAGWIGLLLTAVVHVTSWILGRVVGARRWKLRLALIGISLMTVLLGTGLVVSQRFHVPLKAWKTPLRTLVHVLRDGRPE
jgi:patatin-related protein